MTDVLLCRKTALRIFEQTARKGQSLEDVFEVETHGFDSRDKAFIRMLTSTAFRRLGQIDDLLSKLLKKPLPPRAQKAKDILRLGITQLLFMETPAHAAVDTSVELARVMGEAFYVPLINALLRELTRHGNSLLKTQDAARLNTPSFLWNSWVNAYGEEKAHNIADAHLTEPSVDISVKENPTKWAERLGGVLLPTGSVRLAPNSYIPELPGFQEGAWWVQDAAAALAVRLMGDVNGQKIADLCAAPGGKTAGLLVAGANVDAFDISEKRLERVRTNLSRLHLQARITALNANEIEGQAIYDKILIDAPCSATGTLRRHPDIVVHRTAQDIERLQVAQERLLKTAHRLLKPKGIVVYCTCSLQKEEGEDIIEKVRSLFDRVPITDSLLQPYLTPAGDIRTFPMNGTDGFFMAKLIKKGD